MKILYFMNHADQGGAMLALYDLLIELKKYKDIEPIVITGKNNKFNKMLDNANIENYYAPFKNFISSYKEPKFLFSILLFLRYWISKPFAIRKIEKVINFNQIDLIHTNLDRIDIGAYFSKKYNIPHIWHIREHLDDDFEVVSIYRDYIKHMEKYNCTYIAISNSVRKKWIDRGLPKNKIKLIYDGINEEKIQYTESKENNNKFKLLFLGGYYKNKGQEFCIDAISKLPNEVKYKFKIDFYGNGDEKYIKYLKNKIDNYGLNNISLNNYDKDIYNKLSNYDIGINCSKSEGFGRITVEYMLAGMCPLVSNKGANIEIVDNEKNGIIFEYNNISNFNRALTKLLERKKINKIKYLAHKKAEENFSIKVHAKEIVQLYRKEIKNGD